MDIKESHRDFTYRLTSYFILIWFILTTVLPIVTSAKPEDPPASAGPDTTICEGQKYSPVDATTSKSARLVWTSTGTGSFNKPSILHPTYKPSAGDIAAGSVTLTLSVTDLAGHPDTTCSMVLTIIRAPKAYAGGGDAIRPGDSYMLLYSTAENYTELTWSTSGTGYFNDFHDLHPTYTPSAEDIRFGSVTLTLTAKGNGKCPPAVSDMVLNIN